MSVPALHLVLDEEELLVERAVDAIVAAVRAADPGAEARKLRSAETTPAALAEYLSPSLFAEGRVVVLLAAMCPFTPIEKQALLEAPDAAERGRVLTSLLAMGRDAGKGAQPNRMN